MKYFCMDNHTDVKFLSIKKLAAWGWEAQGNVFLRARLLIRVPGRLQTGAKTIHLDSSED